jgi:hypothetical protein
LFVQRKNQRKGAENANFSLFVCPLHKALTAPPKRLQFAPFSVLPPHRHLVSSVNNIYFQDFIEEQKNRGILRMRDDELGEAK